MLLDLAFVAFLGGVALSDRVSGWGLGFGQPLVGACIAGALVNPGPQWELWALRIPLGVGALLQLLLTNRSLPAAQRPHEVATAAVIGVAVALLSFQRFQERVPLSGGGLLWVVVGTVAGLLAAAAGGVVAGAIRGRNRIEVARADALAEAGQDRAFEALYWRGVARVFFAGMCWTAGATLVGVALVGALLPRVGWLLTGSRLGFLFAALLGVALGTAYESHVRARARGGRWAAVGAIATALLLVALREAGS